MVSDTSLLEPARQALATILGGEVWLRDDGDDGAVFEWGTARFRVVARRATGTGAVVSGLDEAARRVAGRAGLLPLLVVPALGPTARALARARGASVLDVAGNAELRAEGLRVVVEGRRARRPPGRPQELFSASSAPLVLAALLASRGFTRGSIAARVHAQASTASRLVARAVELGLFDADGERALRVRRPRELYELVRARWSSLPFPRLEAQVESRSPAARDAVLPLLTDPAPRLVASDATRAVAVTVRLPDAGARALAGLRVVRERGHLALLAHPGLHALCEDDAGRTLLGHLEASRALGAPRTDLGYATRFGTLR